MSDCLFLKDHVESFLRTHPREEGWKVYECHSRLSEELYLGYLLDFLRDRHPDILQNRFATNEVRANDMLGVPQDYNPVVPGSDWDLQKELDANRWRGLIEIEWKGQLIHYCRFVVEPEYNRPLTLVASKSNAAIRDFHARLDEYGRDREKTSDDVIMVVNGEPIPIPNVPWGDLILPPGQAEEIRRNVEAFFASADRYRELGLPHRRGFLFTGPPGCGKTLTLKALAGTIKASFITVHVTSGIDDYDIHHAFRLGNRYRPAVVIFKDLEKLVRSRKVSLSYFLNLLDGLKALEGVLVIATSNDPEQIDPALLHRPSRFDRIWNFRPPDKGQRLALLRKKGGAYFSEGALKEVAAKATGFSMAHVQETVVNALLESAHNGETPSDHHLRRSLETLKAQRKAASKGRETVEDRHDIGFHGRDRSLFEELERFDERFDD